MRCEKCEQIFCNPHLAEHQTSAVTQFDSLKAEHDLIQQEIRHSSGKHSLLERIDQWERESIVKIQSSAERARTELRQMMDTAKDRLTASCHDAMEKLRRARDARQFCENDLRRTMQLLQQLKAKIASPLSAELVDEKSSPIHLITIKGTDFMNRELEKTKVYSISKNSSKAKTTIQEKFAHVHGPAIIHEEGYLARHHGPNSAFAYLRGEQLYSKGEHTIRFKIEHSQVPYNIFFGCISSHASAHDIHYDSPSVAGWFGHNEVYHHGMTNRTAHMHGYDSSKIETSNVVSLTFNCDERQIELYPERSKTIHELAVNVERAPLPWQLLVVLVYKDDCVRILHHT